MYNQVGDITAVFLLTIPEVSLERLDEFLNQEVIPRGLKHDVESCLFGIETLES